MIKTILQVMMCIIITMRLVVIKRICIKVSPDKVGQQLSQLLRLILLNGVPSILDDFQLKLALHLADKQRFVQIIRLCQDERLGNRQGKEEFREAKEPVIPIGPRSHQIRDHHQMSIGTGWPVLGEEGDLSCLPAPACSRVKGPLHCILFGGEDRGTGGQELGHVTKGRQGGLLDNINDHHAQQPPSQTRGYPGDNRSTKGMAYEEYGRVGMLFSVGLGHSAGISAEGLNGEGWMRRA